MFESYITIGFLMCEKSDIFGMFNKNSNTYGVSSESHFLLAWVKP
jgi:hypothetical protein